MGDGRSGFVPLQHLPRAVEPGAATDASEVHAQSLQVPRVLLVQLVQEALLEHMPQDTTYLEQVMLVAMALVDKVVKAVSSTPALP